MRRVNVRLASVSACLLLFACASSSNTLVEKGDTPPASSNELGTMDIRPGTGTRASSGQCLYVHYVGVLPDGRQFETSRDTLPNGLLQAPIVFELGSRTVMPGWERGLVGLQAGGVRRLFVPYRLAYGDNGRPPAIPARTDLIFDIELMAVAAPLSSSSNALRAETAKTCPAWSSISRPR